MTEHRIHYLTRTAAPNKGGVRLRCGNPQPKSWTIDPTKVTCGSCKRLMKGEVK